MNTDTSKLNLYTLTRIFENAQCVLSELDQPVEKAIYE
jgi:hypothetical protein